MTIKAATLPSRRARRDLTDVKPLPISPDAAQTPPDAGKTDPVKLPSKQSLLIALLVRDEGATLDQIVSATGWLPHTTRAALTGLKKKGYALSSEKLDGVRTYRGIAPEAGQ